MLPFSGRLAPLKVVCRVGFWFGVWDVRSSFGVSGSGVWVFGSLRVLFV